MRATALPDVMPLPEPEATSSMRSDAARRRDRWVIAYIALAFAALVPGLAALWQAPALTEASTAADTSTAVGTLGVALSDIRFGTGLRFWLGVAGTSAMGLFLLYPLRKILAGRRALGSVGGWFHLHILLGLIAPVLILYHANFGRGSFNSNVALGAMLVVVLSGIVGYFVHARASAALHRQRDEAARHLADLVSELGRLDGLHPSRSSLVERLVAFDARLGDPRRGFLAILRTPFEIAAMAREFGADIDWLIAAAGRDAGGRALGDGDRGRLLRRHLALHLACHRAAAARAIGERIWARWRLLHLPIFLVMIAAIALHVAAVWNLDRSEKPAREAVARPMQSAAAGRGSPIRQVSRPTIVVSAAPDAAAAQLTANADARPSAGAGALSKSDVRLAAPRTAAEVTSTSPVPPPRPAVRPKPAPPVAQAPTAPVSDAAPLYAEVQRRLEAPMGLGAPKPQTLAEHFSMWKERIAARQFAHAERETGFALDGKHAKAECKDCHSKPPAESKKETQRQCVACHKVDDVHRGRRPDCVQCHTANRWSEIIRRR